MSRQFSQLLLATHNAGKIKELTQLLQGIPVALRNLSEFPAVLEVAETGATFAENATLKARQYAEQTGMLALADDSGLEVDALGGAPGVFSARYGGTTATDAERVRRLLHELANVPPENRRARFVCVAALAAPDHAATRTFRGVCAGHIAFHPQGANGFGYDPIFIPEGYEQTFGQLPDTVKQQVSHRARALAAVRDYLVNRFGNEMTG
ncbi:MAG: XTP/dITP diphosphatase [Acidobacteriota bacterium]|nr:XTP/dITP diphosphatase [Acidobacteriota bacterium]